MITIETLRIEVRGLDDDDLLRWIDNAWVRPDGEPGRYLFREIDVARVRLILELRDEMQVNEEALPVVLSLLDQLYALRRQARQLTRAMEQDLPHEFHRDWLRGQFRDHVQDQVRPVDDAARPDASRTD